MTEWTWEDERRRREEHLTACWQGCDDLHEAVCEYCDLSGCVGDCRDEGDRVPVVVTEYGFEEKGLL